MRREVTSSAVTGDEEGKVAKNRSRRGKRERGEEDLDL
jgi:hypothetical protein